MKQNFVWVLASLGVCAAPPGDVPIERARLELLETLLPIGARGGAERALLAVRYLPSFHPEEAITIRFSSGGGAVLKHSRLECQALDRLQDLFDRTKRPEIAGIVRTCAVKQQDLVLAAPEAQRLVNRFRQALANYQEDLTKRLVTLSERERPLSLILDGTTYEVAYEDLLGTIKIVVTGAELDRSIDESRSLVGWAQTIRTMSPPGSASAAGGASKAVRRRPAAPVSQKR